ncbi:hypothetical protein IFM89_038064 [Coptis chinensis]|uniref:40S ribosomal protein S15 n=1 Tax=Coptis chinensis TaxID=261450 RepID=A0A835H1A5_9MAGN|nr:hypothetical protein IFM89_038064 [Coptis chinensis]
MKEPEVEVGGATPKRRTIKKFAFRRVDLDQLLDMGIDELVKLFTCMCSSYVSTWFEEETHGSYQEGSHDLCSDGHHPYLPL